MKRGKKEQMKNNDRNRRNRHTKRKMSPFRIKVRAVQTVLQPSDGVG